MSRYPVTTPVSTFLVEYRRRPKKNGKPGKLIDAFPVYYCPLYQCDSCPRRGGGHQIQYRSLLGRTLCMACWNRLRVIERDQTAIDELGRLQRKLMRTRHVDQHR